MEVKAGYKQTEVGIIPEDWDVTPLGHQLRRIPTYGINAAAIPFDFRFPTYLRITDITEDGRFAEATKTSVDHPTSASYLLEHGDLVFARTGASVGKSYLYKSTDGQLVFAGFLIRVSPDTKRLAPAFLKFFVQSRTYWNWIKTNSMRSGQPGINGREFASLPVPIPPTLAEQEAIAEALSDADALIEALEQLLAKKRQVKQGAMQELLTGKRRLAGFNEKWEVKTFGDLFNFSGGFTASRDQLSSNGYCYLHYGDIHMSTKTFVDVHAEFQDIPKLNIPLKKVSTTSLLEDGDIVFVDASEDDEGASRHVVIFNPNKIPYISGLHTIVAKSKTDELEHQYRRYCFQTREVKNQFRFYAVGTKVSGISKTNIAKINLPVPSIAEQTAIAEILSDMDAEISALEEKLVKARQVKAGMMSKLLTGKIRLNHD
ncbi:MAG: restriction endonuclease subunit S [Chloroflexota bacterium]